MAVSEYLKTIILPMIKHGDCVQIVQSQDAMGVLLTLTVHQEDMGIIVGKGGDTAKAIRSLVRIVGIIDGARVSVKITEPVRTG